ncbi:MAG TPA: SRPBCC domain-containing protein [Kofleriaceae bacterium]|nr:SRPBCC domain-containing protein [Kofleriaceae bacterium]
MKAALGLEVRRLIPARPERLFEAWTTPAQLEAWWGPRGVRCTRAEIDPRVGGGYRIGNELPDGRVVHIAGEFLVFEPPHRLVYTWRLEGADPERVTVRFEPRGAATEVVVVHERIADPRARAEHERGWEGCLDGLAAFAGR